MSVIIQTSLGDIVIDLYTKECPTTTFNFLKLCKIKYYNNCLFYDVQKDYLAQTGDPENTGKEGNSIYGIIDPSKKYFKDEIHPNLRHNKFGIVSTANFGKHLNTSTFFIQLTNNNLTYLNDKHTVFGKVEEGFDVLEKINKAYVDKNQRPYQNIRIKHTIIMDDPFDDPKGLIIPIKSPEIKKDIQYNRLEDDFNIKEHFKDQETEEKVKEKLQEHEAKNRALVLEMLDDLPDADVKPAENVLFVCKLNPVTQDDDLEIIFGRFGPIKSCRIIRDVKTGESLKYAFIEYEKVEDCTQAYFKMNGVVIDERRIKVDFSQSVARMWNTIKHNDDKQKPKEQNNDFEIVNENKKYEIIPHKIFMAGKNNYGLLTDRDKINSKKSKSRSKSNEIKYKKSRSRSNEEYKNDKDRRNKDDKRKHKKYKRSKSR